MRQSWTDDRLDDLSRGMDERFDRVDEDIKALRADMNEGKRELRAEIGNGNRELRADLGKDIGELQKDSRALHADLLALQRTMIQVGGGVIVALLGLMVTQL